MDRSGLDPDDLRAHIARRLRPVLGHWPDAEVAALVERMALVELRSRGAPSTCVPPPLPPMSDEEWERRRLEQLLLEASRFPSAAAYPAPPIDTSAWGPPVAAGEGVSIRLPAWLTPDDEVEPAFGYAWSGGTFSPGFGAGPVGDRHPKTWLHVGRAAPYEEPTFYALGDEYGDRHVELTACSAAVDGRELRISACRLEIEDYPSDDVDEYLVEAHWDLGDGAWLPLHGSSVNRGGQEVLVAAIRTLRTG